MEERKRSVGLPSPRFGGRYLPTAVGHSFGSVDPEEANWQLVDDPQQEIDGINGFVGELSNHLWNSRGFFQGTDEKDKELAVAYYEAIEACLKDIDRTATGESGAAVQLAPSRQLTGLALDNDDRELLLSVL